MFGSATAGYSLLLRARRPAFIAIPVLAGCGLRSTYRAADKTGVTTVGQLVPVSRAVLRLVEAGSDATCRHCMAPVKFVARAKARQVIANVYEDGRWARVEHFHEECYERAGQPYGEARA